MPMTIGGIQSSSFTAVVAGVRAGNDARMLREVFSSSGLLTEDLKQGLDELQQAGSSVTRAGLAGLRSELIGSLIDVTA